MVTVDVTLTNSDPVSGLEILLPLTPKQLEYVDGSAQLDVERADGHLVSAAVVDNTLRIYVYSLSLKNIKGNDGKLLSFDLKFGKQPGYFRLQPQVELGGANGNAYPVEINSGVLTMLAPQIKVVSGILDYGHVPVRGTYTAMLELHNTGTEPVEVTGLQFSTTEFGTTETSFTMDENETKTVAIEYRPTKPGAVKETVTIMSDAINGYEVAELVADPYMLNELQVVGADGVSFDEVTVQLSLTNMDPIAGVQVEFELPEGIEYVAGTFVTTERSEQLAASSTYENGVLTLLLYSFSNAVIESGEGIIATFRLRLAGEDGTYSLNPLNVTLGNEEGVNVTSAAYGGAVVIKAPVISSDDVLVIQDNPITETAVGKYVICNNGNAPLEIIDAAFLADGFRVANEIPFVLEPFSCDTLYVEYASVQSGGYSTIMNLYTNDPKCRVKSVTVSGNIYEPNALTFDGENLQNGDYVVSVGMDNYTTIVAMQLDIHVVEGMATSNTLLLTTQRLANHTWTLTKLNDTTYRFVAFSLSNGAIVGNEGKLFDLTFVPDEGVVYKDTPIVIDNVVLSGADGGNYCSLQALNVTAEYKNFHVRFVCDGETLSELFQSRGTSIVYPKLPEKTGHSLVWDIEGGNEKLLAIPIDLAGNADEMLYSNAPCFSPGAEFQGWYVLFDNDIETSFHSEYDAGKGSADGLHHYIRVDMGYGIDKFAFSYTTASTAYPTRMFVEGSNVADGVYDEIAELTDLPTGEAVYCSDVLCNGNKYRYIRFRVTETQDNYPYGRPFFKMAELSMTEYALKYPAAPELVPDEDIVLNAHYVPNIYTVTYIVDGEVYATDSVAYGCEIALRDEPTKEGYNFSGWSEAPATMPANDIVIEGSFFMNSYAMIYMLDGEIWAIDSIASGTKIYLPGERVCYRLKTTTDTGETVYLNIANIDEHVDGPKGGVNAVAYEENNNQIFVMEDAGEGYKYLKSVSGYYVKGRDWNVDGSASEKTELEFEDAGNGTFYIKCEKGYFKVEWVHETHYSFCNAQLGAAALWTLETAVACDSDREITLRDEPIKEGHTFSGWSCDYTIMPEEDIVVTGSYIVNTYTVTYFVDGEVYATDSVTYGSEITLIDEPIKEGYTFSGWSEAPATMPAEDVVVEGAFAVNYYTVTYIVDGEIYAKESVAYGSEIVLIDEPVKEGYTFSGWSEAPATMPAEDVTIEGSFAVNYYTVTYIVDGEIYAKESVAYGSEIVLREEPTKEGHTFSGWSEAPVTMPAEDVTIEGAFAVNYYTFTYLVDGEVYATESVAYGSEIVLIDEPVKEGYTFSGWSEAPVTMPAEDVVIEGCFTPVTRINGVEYDAEELIIYNLSGVRIIDRDELERGFYIINGKKVLIK